MKTSTIILFIILLFAPYAFSQDPGEWCSCQAFINAEVTDADGPGGEDPIVHWRAFFFPCSESTNFSWEVWMQYDGDPNTKVSLDSGTGNQFPYGAFDLTWPISKQVIEVVAEITCHHHIPLANGFDSDCFYWEKEFYIPPPNTCGLFAYIVWVAQDGDSIELYIWYGGCENIDEVVLSVTFMKDGTGELVDAVWDENKQKWVCIPQRKTEWTTCNIWLSVSCTCPEEEHDSLVGVKRQ